ncbi:tyrosine-type recombinase/integrase [Vulgatibacter sp.]|uniref:tyrosine-type recombinase/integrase n=1 Tax=Vulgatibacter sp. TaxID=1971226 RepID=UPI0035672A73
MQAKINQVLVDRAPVPPQGKQLMYADPELRGFYFIRTPTKRCFYVQSQVNGRQVRAKIGEAPALDAKEARALAAKTLVSMRSGTNPNVERRQARARGTTLREALDLHLKARALSARTAEAYRYSIEHYLPDWLDRTLAELGQDRRGVRERHVRLTAECGRTTADNTMRVFRSVYNRALREYPELPANPTANVDFHGMRRRKVDADGGLLIEWGRAVLALENDVRRDLHLFMILTGMRRTAACEARVADLRQGALHVPRPKGGAARAFDLPLSRALQELLDRRAKVSRALGSPWLFPADSESGHVEEVKERGLRRLTGHALRHAYATLALEAGVPLAELRFLLNHSGGPVTFGYLHPSLEHLRGHQETATARILDALGLDWQEGSWPPRVKE